VGSSKFYDWRQRCGKVSEHNGWVPRDFWLAEWKKRRLWSFMIATRVKAIVGSPS
jgi:hypothetical protein